MLQWLGKYFICIAAAGLLTAVASACVPENGRAAVRFAGGLLVLLAVLMPLKKAGSAAVSERIAGYEAAYSSMLYEAENASRESAAGILSRLAAAEIEKYALGLGAECRVNVLALADTNGILSLYSASVEYVSGSGEAEAISDYIESSLGIPRERQLHSIGGE